MVDGIGDVKNKMIKQCLILKEKVILKKYVKLRRKKPLFFHYLLQSCDQRNIFDLCFILITPYASRLLTAVNMKTNIIKLCMFLTILTLLQTLLVMTKLDEKELKISREDSESVE